MCLNNYTDIIYTIYYIPSLSVGTARKAAEPDKVHHYKRHNVSDALKPNTQIGV